MQRARTPLVLGLCSFLVGAVTLLRAVEGSGDPLWPGLALLGLSVALLGVGAWLLNMKVDFDRIAQDQRLWESGPLGRLWLRIRQR